MKRDIQISFKSDVIIQGGPVTNCLNSIWWDYLKLRSSKDLLHKVSKKMLSMQKTHTNAGFGQYAHQNKRNVKSIKERLLHKYTKRMSVNYQSTDIVNFSHCKITHLDVGSTTHIKVCRHVTTHNDHGIMLEIVQWFGHIDGWLIWFWYFVGKPKRNLQELLYKGVVSSFAYWVCECIRGSSPVINLIISRLPRKWCCMYHACTISFMLPSSSKTTAYLYNTCFRG